MAENIGDQASKMAERAQAAGEDALARGKETAQQAAAAAKQAADRLAEARQSAWEVAQRAGTRARDLADQAYRHGERQAQELAGRVEERPLLALLIAGVIGYAIALLVHRSR